MAASSGVDEGRGRGQHLARAAVLLEDDVADELRQLHAHLRAERGIPVRVLGRGLGEVLVLLGLVELVEEDAHRLLGAGAAEEAVHLLLEAGLGIQLPALGGGEQRRVRHAVPQRVGQTRGHFVRAQLHQPVAGVGGGQLGAVDEVRRLEHGLDAEPHPGGVGIQVGVELGALVEDRLQRGHLVAGERAAEDARSEFLDELGAVAGAGQLGHQPGIGGDQRRDRLGRHLVVAPELRRHVERRLVVLERLAAQRIGRERGAQPGQLGQLEEVLDRVLPLHRGQARQLAGGRDLDAARRDPTAARRATAWLTAAGGAEEVVLVAGPDVTDACGQRGRAAQQKHRRQAARCAAVQQRLLLGGRWRRCARRVASHGALLGGGGHAARTIEPHAPQRGTNLRCTGHESSEKTEQNRITTHSYIAADRGLSKAAAQCAWGWIPGRCFGCAALRNRR